MGHLLSSLLSLFVFACRQGDANGIFALSAEPRHWVIRSTFTGQQGIDDDVIHGFIQKMRRCQRRLVRKPCNGRLRAIVYTWSTPSSDVVRISYGMCTFTDRTGRGSYRKRDLRQTALKRFLQCGTTIDRPVTQPAYYHRSTRRYVEQLITEAIHDTVRSGAPLL